MREDLQFRAGLDASAMRRGLTSLRADAKGFASKMAMDWKQAFSIAAIVAGLRELGQGMVELRRSAEDLGVSTDFLQSVGRMAVKFGGTAEDANAALMKLNESIGQARTEGGAAAEKFDRFGISLYDANGAAKSSEEVFKEISTAYRNSSDAATKAALAFEFFGRAGRNINNILGEGADGIDAYTAKMKSLWLVSDPAQVDALADAWTRLKTGLGGLSSNIVGRAVQGLAFTFANLGALSSGASSLDALNIAARQTILGEQAAQSAASAAEQTERQRKEAEKLVETEDKIAKLWRDSLADTEDEKLAALKLDVQAARDALHAENDRIKRAEKLLQLEQAKIKVQEQERKIAKDAADLQIGRMDLLASLLEKRKAASESVADRSRFSLQELADANLRGVSDPETRGDIMKAREVQRLMAEGERLRLSGRAGSREESLKAFSRADEIRRGIGSLKSEERLTSMDKNIAEVNEGIKAFNNLASETGFVVRPLMGK